MIDIPDPRTIIYSTLDNSQLKLDYFLPSNATGSLPAIVCFHGGGMTVGDRRMGPGMPIWLFGSFNLLIFLIAQNLLDHLRVGSGKWDDPHFPRLSFAFSKHGLRQYHRCKNTLPFPIYRYQ